MLSHIKSIDPLFIFGNFGNRGFFRAYSVSNQNALKSGNRLPLFANRGSGNFLVTDLCAKGCGCRKVVTFWLLTVYYNLALLINISYQVTNKNIRDLMNFDKEGRKDEYRGLR